MPLIELKTNLKSLGYGDEKPLVTKDINNPPNYSSLGSQALHRVDDLTRITKLMGTASGVKFAANQALLGQIGVGERLKKSRASGKTVGGALLEEAKNTAVDTGKVIGSVLAQVPVAGTGLHFVRGFEPANKYINQNFGDGTQTTMNPFADMDPNISAAAFSIDGATIIQDNLGDEGYRSIAPSALPAESKFMADGVTKYTGNDSRTNSSTTNISSQLSSQAQQHSLPYTGNEAVTNTSVSEVNSQLEGQATAPGAPLTGKVAAQSTSTAGISSNLVNKARKVEKMYTGRAAKESTSVDSADTKLDQFVSELSAEASTLEGQSLVKVYNSGATVMSRIPLSMGDSLETAAGISGVTGDSNKPASDKINLLKVGGDPSGVSDLVTFRIKPITPDAASVLHFRAYIDTVNDSYTGNWDSTKYVGRADEIYSYSGFSRTLSVDFKVFAHTRAELEPMYERLNAFTSLTAPTYNSGKFMRGTYARITIGDYVVDLPVVMDSASVTWDVNTPWEVDGFKVPHLLQVSSSFKVLHDFTPISHLKTPPKGKQYFGIH